MVCKVLLDDYKENGYEEDSQKCCGKYVFYDFCFDCVLCIVFGVMVDYQWYDVKNKGE